MAFGPENVQTADIGNAFAKLDIGSATGHIGRDGDVAAHLSVPALMLPAGLFDDVGLTLVLLGV